MKLKQKIQQRRFRLAALSFYVSIVSTLAAHAADYQFYVDAGMQTNGLRGNYVNQSLRTYSPQDDWRITQTISGSRIDAAINFSTLTWGNLAAVGISGPYSTNYGWELFSVQWDGYVKILTNGVMLATKSDDSSRMWIDINDDSVFNSTGDEFANNNWGTMQAQTVGTFTPPLPLGLHKIRLQFQEDHFGDLMQIVSTRVGEYRDFSGNTHFLEEFRGKYTRLLISSSDLEKMSRPQAREMVDQQDILYAQLKELTGGEPAGQGLLTVAIVETCGAGCGQIGSKGVEIDPDYAEKSVEVTYDFVAHEMTHNFDNFSSYFMFGPDAGHGWTAWIQNYLDVATRHGSGSRNPDKYQTFQVNEMFARPYLSVAGHSWNSCVKSNGFCGGLNSFLIQAGFCHKVSSLHGVAAVQRALVFMRNAITTRSLNPSSMSPEQRNDLMLESFSYGAQTNLTCYVDAWNWEISATNRNQLAALYGNNNTLCADNDGDGYSVVQGDTDDSNFAIHPGAVETVNGLDDNGNGVVDELILDEGTGFPDFFQPSLGVATPILIRGNGGGPGGGDFFHLDITNKTTLEVEVTSLDSAMGWFRMFAPDGSRKTESYIFSNKVLSLVLSLDPGRHEFHVSLDGGRYETLLSLNAPWPPYDFAPTPQQVSPNQWLLTANTIPVNLTNRQDVTLRYWISNQGWIATNSVTATNPSSISLTWTVPTNFVPQSATYRCQYFTNKVAATRMTEARAFQAEVMADQFRYGTNGFVIRFAGNRAPQAVQWQSQDLISWTATKTNQPFLNVWSTTNSAAGNPAFFRVTLGD